MIKIAHIVLKSSWPDIRVMKEADSLSNHYFTTVYILSESGKEDICEIRSDNNTLYRIALKSRSLPKKKIFQIFKFLEVYKRLKNILGKDEIDILHCHDFLALPLGVLLKKKLKIKLFYDVHELYSLRHKKRNVNIYYIEKYLSKFIDKWIFVTNSIRDWYKKEYNIVSPSCVVRNIPQYEKVVKANNSLSLFCKCKKDEILFGYIGKLFKERKIVFLLDVFSKMNSKYKLVFMGDGPLEEIIKDYSRKYSNIFFHPKVPQDKVIEYASGLDVGFNLTETEMLGRKLGLPNKVFQYLFGLVPVIVSTSPERDSLVCDNGWGWAIENTHNQLLQKIKSITKDEIKDKKLNIRNNISEFNWNTEVQNLINLYKI